MKSKMSFEERTRLGMEMLSKRKPVTLEEARAQAINIKIRSSHTIDKEGEIKRLLKMYHPDWTQEQIEEGFDEIQRIISKESKDGNVQQTIASYLKKISEKEILDELLFSPDGRKRAKKIGLEKEFDKEIKSLRKKLPYDVSFREMSILGWDVLAKQKPSSLEEMRAQTVWLHSKSSSGINDLEIKRHLILYFPDWTNKQIEDGVNEIRIIMLREVEVKNTQRAIASYLKRSAEASSLNK